MSIKSAQVSIKCGHMNIKCAQLFFHSRAGKEPTLVILTVLVRGVEGPIDAGEHTEQL